MRISHFLLGLVLCGCDTGPTEAWTYSESMLSLTWLAGGKPVAGSPVDILVFRTEECGSVATVVSRYDLRLDASGHLLTRLKSVPADSIVACVTLTLHAPAGSGLRDTTVTRENVLFRIPGSGVRLDTTRVVVDQP